MSKPIRGDEAVDSTALDQTSIACQYLMKNVRQFSVDTLTTLLAKFDEAEARLKAVLEWRIKQSVGGEHVSRINEKLQALTERLSVVENVIKEATAPTFVPVVDSVVAVEPPVEETESASELEAHRETPPEGFEEWEKRTDAEHELELESEVEEDLEEELV